MIMMKKLLLTSAALVAFSTSPALAEEEMWEGAMTGVYAGALVGYTNADMDTPAGGTELEIRGADYGVFIGYELDEYLDNSMGINGAVEGHFAWSGADDASGTVELEKEHDWGVSFRPGLSIFESINPYAIVGYRRASFEGTSGGVSVDEKFNGFELGVGAELVAYGDYGVRLDYSHIWYGEESGFDPDEDNLRLGLSYHF